jgi:hypothetical protein
MYDENSGFSACTSELGCLMSSQYLANCRLFEELFLYVLISDFGLAFLLSVD